MIDFEEFRAYVRRLKAERWADVLNAEPSGRPPGRRPRDPEQEALLAEADRRRLERSGLLKGARSIPVDRTNAGMMATPRCCSELRRCSQSIAMLLRAMFVCCSNPPRKACEVEARA